MARTLLIDSGPIVAALCQRDRHHDWARTHFEAATEPFVTCEAVISECFHLFDRVHEGKETFCRLLERGVRFVQIWSGNDNGFPRRNWDSHEDIERDHKPLAMGMAIGTAALIRDLKERGLLDETVILWTTEFGRMPSTQGSKGRDHNPYVFTNWLCGAGIRGGVSYGPSDEWGYKPLDRDNPTQVYDRSEERRVGKECRSRWSPYH